MTLTQVTKAGLDELALDHVFTIGASGSDHYTFQGEGLNGTVNDPTLYLTRGKTYRFENGTGAHPIRIQSTSGASGTAYNTGVTNNAGSGTVIVEVQHDAPDVLYYQCTSHANMNGTIYVTGALADAGVTTAKLADDAVTDAKLANSINSAIAANTAKSTNATHTGDVTGSGSLTIASGAVTTAKIAADAVTGAKIADDAINSEHYTNASIDAVHIANNTITASQIANDAVGSGELASNAVTTVKIADEAVTAAKIDTGTITTAKLADDAVTSAKIDDGTIVNSNINSSAAIAGTKISPDFGSQNVETDGEVRTGSYIKTRVASGGHFYLRNNSTGANFSSHLQTCSGGFDNNVQTHLHYYHGGYAELLHQGTSAIRTKSGGGVEFRNGGTRIGAFDTDGLKFGTDTAATNGLHDYEYGSWTPTYNATGGVTGGSYSVQTGQYVKIGRMVHVQFYYYIYGASSSGSFRISGLPYNANSYGAGSVMTHSVSLNTNRWYVLHISNDSHLYLYGSEHNAGWETAVADDVHRCIGSCTYYTTD